MRIFLAIAAAFSISHVVSAQYSWQVQFPSLPAFALPVELVHANDGTNRLFVVQQRGIIYVFENTPGVSTRTVFLDISDRVSQSGSETGLLGLAFHPDSGYFYVNYTSSSSGSLRSYVARYSVSSTNPDSALHDSEIILLTLDQPYENHNGGKLAFGPDGYLYLGFGDGGSGNDPGNRAQNRTVLLGKILRINVDSTEAGLKYAIPPSNPYYRNALGYREEIYAYGVRNPWKFSFDPVTGKLWLGDVGQDTREEVDTVVNGGNYGWRLMEGSICTPGVNTGCQDTAGLIRPVWDYPNLTGALDGSITGGYVYRGSAVPSLYGKYIFGDYISGRTWALTYDGSPAPSSSLLSDESFSISTFGVDTSGNIYLCSYGSSGRIYKLIGPATDVVKDKENIPAAYMISQNYPNPFNPSTRVTFSIPAERRVFLVVYDLLGRKIAVLADGRFREGEHSTEWDASDCASGVYIAKISVLNDQGGLEFSGMSKLVLMR
jgi:glucose/arabinose dehydrogenase